MAKIIIAAPAAPGGLSPLLRLAGSLAARGHRITVVTSGRFRADVENAGLTFVSAYDSTASDTLVFDEASGWVKLVRGPEKSNNDWISRFVDPVADLHAVLTRLFEEDPNQYLICDTLWLGGLPTALDTPGSLLRRWVAVSAVASALEQ
ncbi:hypothetical protein ACFFQW_13195 [Umezawaea endophytica]|uniref:Glycosyl transferase family 28 n=1 Tax=Umezawaea endophytica TaxID=1654476 RepID=A0A9X3AGS2_9PSEU|nr:hypothetical protein [Umezawaea endophytica]MCS7478710.1 hypothetical protein [Umezawaea endophytica]